MNKSKLVEYIEHRVGSRNLKTISGFVISLFVLHFIYSFSVYTVHQHYLEKVKTQIVKRVALDLPTVALEREWLNEAGNPEEVSDYLEALNQFINERNWPIVVTKITSFKPTDQTNVESLSTVGQNVYVVLEENSALEWHGFSPLNILLAIAFAGLVYLRQTAKKAMTVVPEEVIRSPLLVSIDLKNKTIVNPKTNREIELSNKPLCFYSALVEYCLANPDCKLSSNKDLPEEFLMMCQKYFYRLIELGHTIRKRPNFESNLDKTLSEVRAALDEVFANDILTKEIVVPPKAIGEGSRSKVHSFCLTKLKPEFVEIKGK